MLRVRVNGDFTIGGMMMIGRNGASKAIALSLSRNSVGAQGWRARFFPPFFFRRERTARKEGREREKGRGRERRARDDGTVD